MSAGTDPKESRRMARAMAGGLIESLVALRDALGPLELLVDTVVERPHGRLEGDDAQVLREEGDALLRVLDAIRSMAFVAERQARQMHGVGATVDTDSLGKLYQWRSEGDEARVAFALERRPFLAGALRHLAQAARGHFGPDATLSLGPTTRASGAVDLEREGRLTVGILVPLPPLATTHLARSFQSAWREALGSSAAAWVSVHIDSPEDGRGETK